jgi:hypothetical protein
MVRTAGDATAALSSASQAAGIDAKAELHSKGGIVTLPSNSVNFIDQPHATYAEHINPYDIFVWEGKMKLSPESDMWKEVDIRPDIEIDDHSVYDQFVAMAEEEGILGTVWNEWETNWTGIESTSDTNVLILTAAEAEALGFTNTTGNANATAKVNQTVTATTETGTASRSGLTTSVTSDKIVKEIGSYVIEVNFIPFMRSRKVYFDAELLKPNTKLYAFFAGTDITGYCRQEFSDNSAPYAHVSSDFKEFSGRTGIDTYGTKEEHPGPTVGGSTRGSLVSDASGRCIGSFIIPRNSKLKFKCGAREFKLTESSTNLVTAEVKAATMYYAQGLLEVHQKTVISTKIPRLVTREVNQSGESVERTDNSTSNELVRWYDPLAQSFKILEGEAPNGIFAKSIDLYFSEKDAAIPVDVSIRSMQNGIPTQFEIPGTSQTIYPADVNIHATGNTATNVAFDYPVYLEAGQEYAIVLIANAAAYKVWVAEVGGFDIADTTKRIIKQPYNGVFFTSANASTWSPEQTKDMKFKLNRCVFTGDKAEIILNNDVLPVKILGSDPLEYLTDTTIRVNHKNHGMYGSGTNKVTLDGFVAENGITDITKINKTHTITNNKTEHDSYVITHTGSSTDEGIVGGGLAMTATEDQIYNVLKPVIQTIELDGTSIELYLTAKKGASMDSGESSWGNALEQQIVPNKNFVPDVAYAIAGPTTEAQLSTGKTVILRAVLNNGGDEFITPVIDLNRAEVICAQNRINDPSAAGQQYTANGRLVAETNSSGTGGTAVSKYLTKKIDLSEEADLIDVYLSVNRPTGSNIDVYYRAQNSGSDSNFNTLPWVAATSSKTIPINDAGIYHEVHYAIDPTINSVGYKFGAYAVKIVFRSTNSSKVPTCKDLRAIATT